MGAARLVGLIVSVGGMLVFALLIGIVADEISVQVDELRKGEHNVAVTVTFLNTTSRHALNSLCG